MGETPEPGEEIISHLAGGHPENAAGEGDAWTVITLLHCDPKMDRSTFSVSSWTELLSSFYI